MKSRKGFTLIELMVVVLIVAVLAAVLVPLMTARLESARWSEGKAGVGTIATALRAMYAEQGDDFVASSTVTDYLNESDLLGKYFRASDYIFSEAPSVIVNPTSGQYPITYIIRVQKPAGASPDGNTYTWKVNYWEMDETGDWSKG
jgi:prepilin-type N-terminal cleavage/methylation domain-containing protein